MACKTVLLVDAHSIVRQGCLNALAQLEDRKVVGEAACGREELEKAKTLKPTIMVTDPRLPSLSGIEIIRQLKTSPSQTHSLPPRD